MRRSPVLRRVIVLVVVVSVGSLGLPPLLAGAITQANEITYVYDELGRLEAVVDPGATNGIATYGYDGAGNLLSITRQSVSATTIVDFHPKTAKRSTTVTIYGAGFSSTPGSNTVKFGGSSGTDATVTSATTTQLAVTVPASGSVDGAIYVSSPNGSSTSTQQFTLDPSAAPTITGFTPTTARLDVNPPPTVTISGTGFDASSPKANNVFFNGIRAEVTAATSTSLTAAVPPFTTRGKISVRTSAGEATSTDDFVVTPLGVDPSRLETVTRTTVGTPTTLSITSQGKVSLAMFDGTEGERIFLNITNSGFLFAVMAVRDPFGRVLSSVNFGSPSGFIDTMTLPVNGTYSVVMDQGGGSYTGSATVTITDVPADLSGSITPGTPKSGTIADKGQNAGYTFSASANQQATVSVTGSTIFLGYIGIRFSDGSQVINPPTPFGNGNTTIGPVTLPLTDTYTLTVDPSGAYTGSYTLTLSLTGGGGGAPNHAAIPARPPTSAEMADFALAFQPGSAEEWVPTELSRWTSDRSQSPFEFQSPLRAPRGITALSGTVLRLDGEPLPGVTLGIGSRTTTTDATGRFLLARVRPGDQVLEIDGATASTAESTYGRFEAPVSLKGGRTTALDFTIWMPKLDTAHAVHVDSPTKQQVVVASPLIPGLKLVIPKGSVIRGEDGDVVNKITITPIPIDRPPYPLFANPTMYFTIQPEGAEISPYGARLIYPNYQGFPPGRTVPFVIHEADEGGWETYGSGTVSRDGSEIVPDPGVRIKKLRGTGAPPLNAWIPAALDASCYPQSVSTSYGVAEQFVGRTQPVCGGDDPVDSSTGLFSHRMMDLRLPGPMPIELTRFYHPLDVPISGPDPTNTYMFGQMMQTNYESYLYNPDAGPVTQQYVQLDLLMPGERRVHYARTSLGTDFQNAVLEATGTPGPFHKSIIKVVNNNWVLTRRDGTVFTYGYVPVLREIRDRFGNRVMVLGPGGSAPNPTSLSFYNPITQIVSYPSGRWINLKYTGHRVTEVKDDLGRSIKYTYTSDRLQTVVDANQSSQQNPKPTIYTWNSVTGCGQVITAVKDPRNITFLSNTYDASCRVTDQFVPIDTTGQTDNFHFGYTVDGQGKITQTDITDPNGNVTRTTYDSTGYPTSEIDAFGTPSARTFTYAYDPTTHRTTSVTDSFHSRQTDYGYNPFGDLTSVTRLVGTPSAVTTNYTYDPVFHQLQTVTDPLQHITRFDYDAKGCLDILTDPMSRQTLFDCNGAGQITSVTDPLTHQTQFAYAHGDLTTVTDPLNRATSRFTDAGGRVLSVTDPLNYVTAYAYDALNQLTTVTDAKGRSISLFYDEDGNLIQVKDDRNASPSNTFFAYNDQNLVSTRTDPLSHAESFTHDNNGNITLWTDRKSQLTEFRYDPLDHVTFAGFNRTGSPGHFSYASTINYTYDVGARLTQIADNTSGAGTITRTFDDLDRLTNEKQVNASNQGVTYTYNTDSSRATMTVQGATQVTYGYNNAAQLTSLTQGAASVSLSYFTDGRLQTVALKPAPNPISQTYAYDAASEISSISYGHGGSTDDLSYTYDPAGRRTAVYGTYGRTGLPGAATGTYDAANRLLAWNGANASYDLNGNLTGDGTFTYVYNARNQLTTAKQGSTTLGAFVNDGLGRRVQKTISSVISKFVYDGWNVAQEKDSKNKITFNEQDGLSLDQVFSRTPATGTASYVLSDALGSALGLADANGVVQTSYTYEPYGKTTASGAASTNPVGFTGRENDSTGSLALYNYRTRSYSPTLQRFLTEDLTGFAGGAVNLYAYVGNSPTNFVDPVGLEREGGDGGCGGFGLRCAFGFISEQTERFLSDVGFCVQGAIEAFVAIIPIEAAAPPSVAGALAVGCAGGVAVSEASQA